MKYIGNYNWLKSDYESHFLESESKPSEQYCN